MSELNRLFKRAVLNTVLNEGIPALLGKVDGTLFYIDDNDTHHKDRVWARIGLGAAQVEAVVRCVDVPQVLNTPVIVADRSGVLTVIRTDTSRALDWSGGQLVNVQPHNWTHGRYGPDPLYVTGLAFLPLAAYPSSPPDLTVTVERCFYRYQATHKVFERTTSSSLSAYRPAGTEVTHYVILALDRSDNTLDIIDGADVTGGNRVLPSASTVLATSGILPQHFPIAAIRLYNGQTQIMPRDIFMDLRLWAGESSASGSGGGVEGPTSSTDNAIARWDGTDGLVLQDSTPTIDDSGNLDLGGNELRDYSHQIVAANTGANYEIDWAAGGIFELTLTANCTFTFANVSAGRAITLLLIQDGTGGRTATWPGAVDWPNATAPRLSSTAADVDVITLICQNDGSTVSGSAAGLDVVEQQVIKVDASQTAHALQIEDASDTLAFIAVDPNIMLGIGDGAVATVNRFIDLDGTLEGSAGNTAYGIVSTPSAGTGATSWIGGFYGRADVDSGITVGNAFSFIAVDPVVAGTANTAGGLYCGNITSGTSFNYAIYTDQGDVRIGDELITTAGRIVNTTRVTTTYTALVSDHVIYCDTDGGAFTLTLPAGVEGTHYKVINCGSSGNALTVDGDGAETVWGQATATLNDGDILDIHYNATEGWW